MSDATFTFRVDEDLKKQFAMAAKERDRTGNPAAALALDELFAACAARLIDHPGIGRAGRVRGTRAHPAPLNDSSGRGADTRSATGGRLKRALNVANARGNNRPFAVFESADLGAAKRMFKALLALASARQPKNSFGVWKLALQGEVPPGAAGAGAMNSRGSNLNG